MSEVKLIDMLDPHVKRFISLGGMLTVDEGVGHGVYVQAMDYDALAAQRDEGLAREAELRNLLMEAHPYTQKSYRLFNEIEQFFARAQDDE